jgi:hypothetical protein
LDVGLSKRACPKILATAVWPLADVLPHWDELRLQSWIHNGLQSKLYQAGTAQELLSHQSILTRIPFRQKPARFVVLLGTLPVIGNIRSSAHFLAELYDPIHRQTIRLDYKVHHLGNVMDIQ